MNTILKSYLLLIVSILLGNHIYCQSKDLTKVNDRNYCIAIKQSFKSKGDCNNAPEFNQSKILFNNGESKIIKKSDLGKWFTCSYEKDKKDKITIDSYVDDIKNDKKQFFIFYTDKINSIYLTNVTKSASDPCHNVINVFNRREKYSITTTVIKDGPVDIYSQEYNNKLGTSKYLNLNIGNFYQNEQKDVYLQYKLGDDNYWQKLGGVEIKPNSRLRLKYSTLVGNAFETNKNYFKYLGKEIQFRIVKKLLDGNYVCGKIISNVYFYPDDVGFEIINVKRSSCDENVIINVKMNNDIISKAYANIDTINKIDEKSICWYLGIIEKKNNNNNTQDTFSHLKKCKMVQSDNKHPYLFTLDGEIIKYLSSKESELELKLFLNIKDEKFPFYCYKYLKIPPKPKEVEVKQNNSLILPENKYNFYSANGIYALLDIKDNYKYAYTRRPYKIYDKNNIIAKVDSIPEEYKFTYENSESQANDLYKEFNVLLKQNKEDKFSQWGQFLRNKYDEWYKNEVKPISMNSSDVPSMEWIDIDNSIHLEGANYCYVIYSDKNRVESYNRIYEDKYPVYIGDIIAKHIDAIRIDYNKDSQIKCRLREDIDFTIVKTKFEEKSTMKIKEIIEFNFLNCTLNSDNTISNQNIYYKIYSSDIVYHGASNIVLLKYGKKDFRVLNLDYGKVKKLDVNVNSPLLSKYGRLLIYFDSKKNVKIKNLCSNTEDIVIDNVTEISEILYYNSKGEYYIYKTTNGNIYKQKLKIESYDEIFDTVKAGIDFNGWFEEFKKILWPEFLKTKSFFRLYGLKPNVDYNLQLEDEDGCRTDFKVKILTPKNGTFEKEIKTNPTTLCAKDGEVSIKYKQGGSGNYEVFNGEKYVKIEKDELVKVTKLGYNDEIKIKDKSNNRQFTIPADFTIPNVVLNIKSQSSIKANGIIELIFNENKNRKITIARVDNQPVYGNGIDLCTQCNLDDKEIKFEKLRAGFYNIIINEEGCITSKNNIEIKDECVYIGFKNDNINNQNLDIELEPVDIDNIIGQEGLLKVHVKNNKGKTIIIKNESINNIKIEKQDYTENISLSSGEYNFKISFVDSSGREIKQEFEFEIRKPSYKADVIIEKRDKQTTASIHLYDLYNLNNYQLKLNNVTKNTYIDISNNYTFTLDKDSEYKFLLQNKNKNNDESEIYTFSIPTDFVDNQGFDILEEGKCIEKNTEVQIGKDNSEIKYSLNGFNTEFSDKVLFETKETSVTYYSKKTDIKPTNSNNIKVTQIIYKTNTKEIPRPKPIQADISISDITCNGLNDGKILIDEVKGGILDSKFKYNIDGKNFISVSEEYSGLNKGEHTLYIKDVENGCKEQEVLKFSIEEPEELKISTIKTQDPICEKDNGKISVEFSGGRQPYEKRWLFTPEEYKDLPNNEKPKNEDDYDNYNQAATGDTLASGNYVISIRDVNGCEAKKEETLNEYKNPFISKKQIKDVSCFGDNDGEITITEVKGTSSVAKISFNDGATTQYTEINNSPYPSPIYKRSELKKGIYKIQLEDVNSCKSSEVEINIKSPEAKLEVNVDNISDVLYKSGKDGYAIFDVIGGNIGSRTVKLFDKDNILIQEKEILKKQKTQFKNLYAGNYSVIAKDIKGCESEIKTINIKEPQKHLSFEVVEKKDALCKAKTGEIIVKGIGGWGGYKFKRATYNSFYPKTKFENLRAGSYLISVKDMKGAIYTSTVKINEPKDKLMLTLTDSKINQCYSAGEVQVNVKGGVAPYLLSCANHQDIKMPQSGNYLFDNLNTGAYIIRAKDHNGCYFDMETIITENNIKNISFNFNYPNKGEADGSITATFEGGTSPYSYRWISESSTIETNQNTLSNIKEGYYTLEITDANGCSKSKSILLPNKEDRVLSINTIGNETRFNENDGFIILDSINANKIILYNNEDGNKETFEGAAIESLKNNNQLELKNLFPGEYDIVFINKDKYVNNFTIKKYQQFDITNIDKNFITKKGTSEGKVEIEFSGGEPDYFYSFSNSSGVLIKSEQTKNNFIVVDNLKSGVYTVEIKDKYNNVIHKNIEIQEPESNLKLNVKEYSNITCNGYKDGYISLEASGGWGDYQYKSSTSEYYSNTSDILDLKQGEYTFNVIDKAGTVVSKTVKLEQPDVLRTQIASIDSVLCKGESNGKISFNITGGTAPYSYSTLNGKVYTEIDNTVDNLSSGEYTFVFKDENGCYSYDTIKATIPEPEKLVFSNIDVKHSTCEKDNGSISVFVEGGTLPYSYNWKNNNKDISFLSKIDNLKQNEEYTVSVTDKNGCETKSTQRINSSKNPKITEISVEDALCFGDNSGKAQVIKVTESVPKSPYHFEWWNGSVGEKCENIKSGYHSVKIKDDNGCENTMYFTVNQPQPISIKVDKFKDAHCYGYSDGYIKVKPLGGVEPYKYSWSNGSTETEAKDLKAGKYSLTVTDNNNCSFTKDYYINEPKEKHVDLGEDIVICPKNVITIDGKDFTEHLWSNKDNEKLSDKRYYMTNKPGDYFLRVTDTDGCFAYDTINVSVGYNALKANFLLSSEAALGDTLDLYELSNLPLDSMVWKYNEKALNKIVDKSSADYILQLKTLNKGMYNVELNAYSGGCVSKITKQVEIIDVDKSEKENIFGYKESIIKSFMVTPNPTDGRFNVSIELRKPYDAIIDIYSVNEGIKIDKRKVLGEKSYSVSYSLTNLNPGVYVVILNVLGEKRQVKILIN